jgi:hypothetical protein
MVLRQPSGSYWEAGSSPDLDSIGGDWPPATPGVAGDSWLNPSMAGEWGWFQSENGFPLARCPTRSAAAPDSLVASGTDCDSDPRMEGEGAWSGSAGGSPWAGSEGQQAPDRTAADQGQGSAVVLRLSVGQEVDQLLVDPEIVSDFAADSNGGGL